MPGPVSTVEDTPPGLKPSTAKVLGFLRDAGSRGVTTHELLHGGCGSRYGGRIHELRKLGYDITAERERQGSYRYTLISEPTASGALGPARSPGRGGNPVSDGRGAAALPRPAADTENTTSVTAGEDPSLASPAGALFDLDDFAAPAAYDPYSDVA